MTISDEIKSLLSLKQISKSELQKSLGLSRPQAMSTKFSRNSWSTEDLIKFVKLIDGELIIRVADREIKLTENHLTPKQSGKLADGQNDV